MHPKIAGLRIADVAAGISCIFLSSTLFLLRQARHPRARPQRQPLQNHNRINAVLLPFPSDTCRPHVFLRRGHGCVLHARVLTRASGGRVRVLGDVPRAAHGIACRQYGQLGPALAWHTRRRSFQTNIQNTRSAKGNRI